MKEVYVVCRNFKTDNVQVFAESIGWNNEKADLFDSEVEAFVTCGTELLKDGVSIEKFVTGLVK